MRSDSSVPFWDWSAHDESVTSQPLQLFEWQRIKRNAAEGDQGDPFLRCGPDGLSQSPLVPRGSLANRAYVHNLRECLHGDTGCWANQQIRQAIGLFDLL